MLSFTLSVCVYFVVLPERAADSDGGTSFVWLNGAFCNELEFPFSQSASGFSAVIQLNCELSKDEGKPTWLAGSCAAHYRASRMADTHND